ncbi:MAG TPA: helix-turn-helix domain-containing protein [Dongiaceae bacterium]|nr:helix-turn-helix domain-containing protein [Dongiaceae bacterium]
MAKNKRNIERQVKQEEIEAVATRLFVERGYDATSMAQVAEQAGVAPNTLYWYYKNKDEMLVATLNRLVGKGLSEYAMMADQSLDRQLLWLLEQFEQFSALITTVHARIEHATAVREWHANFHLMLDQLMISRLRALGVPADQAGLLATVGGFVVEGLLSHSTPQQQREAIVQWLLRAGLQTPDSNRPV